MELYKSSNEQVTWSISEYLKGDIFLEWLKSDLMICPWFW